jgi:hypothetical protein
MSTKKRYRTEAERTLWLGIIESGVSSSCDLSGVGVPVRRREWRYALVIGAALMAVAFLVWLR